MLHEVSMLPDFMTLLSKVPSFLRAGDHFSALPHSLGHNMGKRPGTRNTFKISCFYQDKIIIFQIFPPPWQTAGDLQGSKTHSSHSELYLWEDTGLFISQ